MSFKLKSKKVLITLLSTISLCCLSLGTVLTEKQTVNVQADSNFTLQTSLPSSLSKGDTLSVPKGMFGDTAATAYVIAPDGSVYASDKVTVQKHGVYTIQYSAVVNGEIVLHEETFKVDSAAYTFNNEKSTATYVENQELAKRDGLLVNIAQGDTFTFNQVIDLNNFTAENPSVKFTVVPQQDGKFDTKSITVTFTDLYDPNNKAEVKYFIEESEYTFWNRCLARANNQAWKGWDNTQSTPYLWVNAYGHYYNFYAKNDFSYNGTEVHNLLKRQYLGAHVIVDTNEICIAWKAFIQNIDVAGTVVDLDDASYQDELFEGFTTGEVLVSVSCEGYTKPSAQLLFLTLGDADLSSTETTDAVPPTIVLSDETDITSNGIVGGSFPVFKAVGLDSQSDGYVDVKTRVYYNYNREDGVYHTASTDYVKEISVTNGKFKTEKAGKYAICYSAVDYYGNYTERVINITVTDTKADITNIYLQEGYATTIQRGNLVELAKVIGYEGGYRELGGRDEVVVDYEITKGEKKITYFGNDVSGYFFIPEEEGSYDVSITLTDYVGMQKTVSYTIAVTKQTAPAFTQQIHLPKYIVEGAEYVLPDVYGKSVSGTSTKASIMINDGNGLRKYTSGSKTTFLADRRGNVEITYSLNANTQSFTIPVVALREGRTIDASKYFVGNNFKASVESKGVLLALSGDSDIEFINALLDEVFVATFELGGFGENFNEFTIGLTDSEDISQRVEMTFLYNGKGVDVYVNGELRQKNVIVTTSASDEVTVGWDAPTASWMIGSSLRFEMDENVYGLPFDGFTSRKVYMDFSAKTNGTNATVFVKKIINQDMGTISKSDNRQPDMILEGGYDGLMNAQGSILNLFSAVGGDVLSPYCSVTLTVLYNDQPVTAVDGTLLSEADCSNGKSYQLQLSEYGEYTIMYTVKDWNNRTNGIALLMRSADCEAPKLSMDSTYTVKDGKVILSDISVRDNYSIDVMVYTTVITPSGKMLYVKDNTFSAEEKGEYEVSVMAMDEFGNCTEIQLVITID